VRFAVFLGIVAFGSLPQCWLAASTLLWCASENLRGFFL